MTSEANDEYIRGFMDGLLKGLRISEEAVRAARLKVVTSDVEGDISMIVEHFSGSVIIEE